MEKNRVKNTVCFNCEKAVNPDDSFCANCGQANHPTKMTISILVKDFVSNFFNLDSRFFKTLRYILLPAFLTKEYLAGKRRSYANPIRLFIISIVVCFAAAAYMINEETGLKDLEKAGLNIEESIAQSKILDNFNAYVDTSNLSTTQYALADSVRKHVLNNISTIDSNYVNFGGGSFFNMKLDNFRILKKDVSELSYDDLFLKYDITKTHEKVIVKQTLKAMTNPASTIRFGISNSFWIIILTIIFSSFTLKILYIRGKFYLLEHIVLQCNIHSLFFFFLTILFILISLFTHQMWLLNFVAAIFYFYAFFVFKSYYHQGYFKTFFKLNIYLFNYFIFAILCGLVVLLVSFIIF